ncbi:MAG: hypothetical protein HKN39_00905 [Flavobacteriales bacterium]|nr:hypothetical protein [Flavobacteriales bacterium]
MKKAISYFSKLVIVLTILSVFGWAVKHITLGDKKFGFLENPIKQLSDFPDLFKQSAKEVAEPPKTFVKTPEDFNSINRLSKDVLALVSYSNENNGRTVDLLNFRNDSVLYSWVLNIKKEFNPHDRIWHSLMLPDKSLVYSNNGGTGLFRADSLGNIIWYQDSIIHHHSMNLDNDGNLWACSYIRDPDPAIHIGYRGLYHIDDEEKRFIDNSILKLDVTNGNKLFEKSIIEILLENDLEYLILQSGNSEDPLHLNDVQPALITTGHYNKGDVFLSFRNSSFILHYRPETNSLIEVINGPFSSQHDIDFYDENTLAIFNNNTHYDFASHKSKMRNSEAPVDIGNWFSQILFYDLGTKEYRAYQDSTMKANKIFTFTEGLQEFIDPNTVFIEEQNTGVLWVLENDEVLYKNVLPSQHKGYHHLPNWTRLLTENK